MQMRALAILTALAAIGFGALIVLSETYLGQGQGILDGRFAGYDAAAVLKYMKVLPPEALAFYTGTFWLLDTIVPVLIALSLGGIIWTYGRGMMRGLVVLAPLYLGFDLFENALTRRVLNADPDNINADTVDLASTMTQGKWLFILALIAWALLLWRKREGTA